MQIDLLQEITQSPRILSEVDAALKAKQMKADVDEYLKVRSSCLIFFNWRLIYKFLFCNMQLYDHFPPFIALFD